MTKTIKTLVFAETERAGRQFYPLPQGEAVGYRRYEEYHDGEAADKIVVKDEKQIPKKPGKK